MENIKLRLPGGSYAVPETTNDFPSVHGTQTETTASWTGVCDDIDELHDGLTILYWLPYTSANNVTLNLTIAKGVSTGPINCYYKGAIRLGTQYSAGDILLLTYKENVSINGVGSYTGWWAEADYNTDNYYSLTLSNEVYCKSDITSGTLIVGDTSGYEMLQNSKGFNINYPILYHNGDVLAGGKTNVTETYYVGLVNPTLTFTSVSLTPKSLVYIKGLIRDKSTFIPYEAELITSVAPITEDGFYYMLLGYVGEDTSYVTLMPNHPIYYYTDGSLVQYLNGIIDKAVSAVNDSDGNKITATYAKLLSPEFKGVPTAPTAEKGNNSNQIATTAYVLTAIADISNTENNITTESPAFTGVPTAPTAAIGTSTTQIATTEFVQTAINNSLIADNEAMIFKGTIGTDGTVTELPEEHKAGWTYKVVTAGTYAGKVCEAGDTIICTADGTVANDEDWNVLQSNIDGVVTGPTTSVDLNVAVFDGTTGKVIKDSGFTIAASVPADAKFTDTIYELPEATTDTLGGVKLGSNITLDENNAITISKENIINALGYTPVDTTETENNKVVTELATTSKAYITGTTTSENDVGGLVFDTGVYLDTTEGHLVANVFKGILVGNADSATKALQDGDGNVITETYATKSEIPTTTSQLINDNDYITSKGSISGNAATATVAEVATKAVQDSEGNVINETYAKAVNTELTGIPTAPTAEKGTSTTQIATTEFVINAISDIQVGSETIVSWEYIKNVPETFKPSEHFHNAVDIKGLHDVATSGDFHDLNNIPTALSEFENDIGFVTTDTKYDVMSAASDTSDGKSGLVPAPTAGADDCFLRGDGQWVEQETYSIATNSEDGLMSASDKEKLDKITFITTEDIDSMFESI